jgi:hypothetical protein
LERRAWTLALSRFWIGWGHKAATNVAARRVGTDEGRFCKGRCGRAFDYLSKLRRIHRARLANPPFTNSAGPGDRKSVQRMAERVALGDYDQLHHFIAAGVWDAGPVETELLVQADKLVGGSDAALVIDDTAIPKKGTHSVGVACAVCFSAWQDRELPDPGVADTGNIYSHLDTISSNLLFWKTGPGLQRIMRLDCRVSRRNFGRIT